MESAIEIAQGVGLFSPSSVFDGVIDFENAMKDPAQPDMLNPSYDSGDHLHPSETGYKAMAEAIPFKVFD